MVTSGGCIGWLKQRTNLEKTLLSLSSLLVLTLLLLILIGVTTHETDTGDKTSNEKAGCWSKECITTAGQVLSKMDEGIDPCSNFYEYSCGNYGGKPGQTSSVAQTSVDSVYLYIKELLQSSTAVEVTHFETVKSLYKMCIEFDGLHRDRKESAYILLELMDRFGIGNWPVVSTAYEDTERSISDRLASLAMLGVPVAFRTEVVQDPQARGSYMLKVSPGGPLSVGRLAIDIRKDHDLSTYMLSSLLLLGAPTYLRATTAVDDILSVDTYYATVEQDTERSCDTIDTLTPEESLNQLNILMPEMNWTSLLLMIQRQAGLKRGFAVEIHCKAKIRDYLIHLNDVSKRTSYNYLGWRFFESFAKHIGPAFGRPQEGSATPRWKECVLLLEQYAGPMLALALRQYFVKDGTREKTTIMNTNSLTVAEKLVTQTKWLNPEERSSFLQQVEAAKSLMTTQSSSALKPSTNESLGLRLPEIQGDNYTAVVIDLRKQRIIQQLKALDPANRSNMPWEMYLTSAAPESMMHFDKIREPYLRISGPDWMNYGGYGVFTARQLSEGLLPNGMESTSEEVISFWDLWSDNKTASSCLRNLSSKYFRTNMLRMDSKESLLREIFLDAGALELALEAARSGAKSGVADRLPGLEQLSDEQMFYVAYAQTWCEERKPSIDASDIPVKDRVNTLAANSMAFDEAFSCSSTLVPRKCRIWS